MGKMDGIMEESFDKMVMECNNCHLTFHVYELKIDPVNDYLICINCFSYPGSKIRAIERKPSLARRSATITENEAAQPETNSNSINSVNRPARIRIRNAT